MRYVIPALTILATTALSTPAMAQQDVGGGISISGNAAVVTDYRFRGVSFSGEDFAIQGGIDIAHDSGFYVGTWGSSLEEETGVFEDNGDIIGFGHTELDVYAGWSGEIASGTELDVGILYYIYPNANNNITVLGVNADFDTDYFEPYVSLSHTLGPAQLTVGAAYAWDQSSIANDDNIYIYSDVGIGIPTTPITFNGHLGYTNGSLSVDADNDYWDWSLGLEAVFGPMTIGVAYVDTNVPGAGVDGTVVGSLGVSF